MLSDEGFLLFSRNFATRFSTKPVEEWKFQLFCLLVTMEIGTCVAKQILFS